MVTQARPDLDVLPIADVVERLVEAEQRVVPAVKAASPAIAAGAELVAHRWRQGGRLILIGAGTSGRLAWAQAAELPGTFGLDRTRIVAAVAGGVHSTDDAEDDPRAAETTLAELRLTPADVVVAVAASGSTPYTVDVARAARASGAAVVAVVTVKGSELAALATVAIEAVVGPEVLRGSTRLGAGTAQKLVLDALTTAAFALLGRVHGDHMVDVVGANAKLRDRVTGIVVDITGAAPAAARQAVDACDGNARAAVLVLVGELDPATARDRAAAHATLRGALSEL